MKKTSFLLAVATSGILLFNSCSKNKDTTPANKHVKATITLTSEFKKAEGDYFSVTISGNDQNAHFTDWNVNGVKKTGVSVEVGTDDFNGGKTIVLESLSDVFSGGIEFGGFENANTPFTVSWKIEVGNTVKDEGSEKIVKNQDPVFSKAVSF
ncbi:hypothetical protein A8C56_17280 [Niabella ginsenosidivorans]|uniref:Lipoprotein n=1 Tax=Niabella ginsenosidivorans TaxID=1176587 RepID=A0A1A9I488_9BACT|nr:hypothetical protein [Niabella ginsenosidivorans]ANH82488.1 hypothetical protein A8C56_17280 [Niabella ginsenosidivorans]